MYEIKVGKLYQDSLGRILFVTSHTKNPNGINLYSCYDLRRPEFTFTKSRARAVSEGWKIINE